MKNRLDNCSERITRLRLKLMEFNYTIKHVSGKSKKHFAVDLLSRTNFNDENSDRKPGKEEKILITTRKELANKTDQSLKEFEEFCNIYKENSALKCTKINQGKINLETENCLNIIFATANLTSLPENIETFIKNTLRKHQLITGIFLRINNTFILTYKDNNSIKTDTKVIFKLISKILDQLTPVERIQVTFIDDPFIELEQIIKIFDFYFHNKNQEVVIFTNKITEILSQEERLKIIENFHNTLVGLHRGINTTFQNISKQYKWKDMKKEIREFIVQCHQCQTNKDHINRKKKIPLKLVTSANSAMEKLHIDAIGVFNRSDKNNCYCITAICELSRFLFVIPVPDLSTETIAEALVFNIFNIFGLCRYMVTDNGASFSSELLKRIAKHYKINQIFCTVYHPQSNGVIERSHHTIKTMIKSFLNDQLNNWDELLKFAVASYNFNYQSSIGTSPYSVMFGREPRHVTSNNIQVDYNYDDFLTKLKNNTKLAEEEAKKHIFASRCTQKERYDKNTQNFEPEVGQKVLLKTHYVKGRKFLENFTGPCTIIEVFDEYCKILNQNNKVQKIHKNNMKLYNEKA